MHPFGNKRLLAGAGTLALTLALGGNAAEIKDSLKVVAATNDSASASQEKIDQLARDTRNLVEEYRKLLDGSEYQAAFTRELEELAAAQEQQLASLREQITQARITQQRIVPLMRSMADALENFVILDLPFHQDERIGAVLELKERLRQPDISVSAKFRTLLEAYQLEQAYGGNVESWRGPLVFGGEDLSVEFLRIGRVALYFQTLDGQVSGYWDAVQRDWALFDGDYNRELARALRVAQGLVAPQLLQLPMPVLGNQS
ncbi:MAG: DUF3450 domain-containing protein [Pseudomonadales bacterium]|nr:DUF3450 domain-containing protein [Pseudomonadales bacterium]MCP5203562.1 DUF3450 domain-containing protein [Pseudomonadales bacterium]